MDHVRDGPPRVAMFGVFGLPNYGNDASLEVFVKALRRAIPNIELTGLVADADYITRKLGIAARPMYLPARFLPTGPAAHDWRSRAPKPLRRIFNEAQRWADITALFKDTDYVLVPGTGVLDDYGTPAATGHPYRLWQVSLVAKRCDVPFEFASVGVGKYNTKLGRTLGSWAARLATRRSFRDQQSKERARDDLGVDVSRDEVACDMAFALPHQQSWERPPSDNEIKTVGIGVQIYHNRVGRKHAMPDLHPDYMTKLEQFCLALLDRGLQLRIIISDVFDIPAVNTLRARLVAARPDRADAIAAEPIDDIHELCAEIARCDAVLATRFHNVLASLIVGRPTVSLEYASKNRMLMERFGLGAYCESIEEGFTVERLLAHFDGVTAEPAATREAILAHTAVFRAQAEAFLKGLAERVQAEVKHRRRERAARAPRDFDSVDGHAKGKDPWLAG